MSSSDSNKLLLYRFVDDESNRGIFGYLQCIDSDYTHNEYIWNIIRWYSDNVIPTRNIIKNLGIDYSNVRHYFKSTAKYALYQMYKLKRYINKKYKNKIIIIPLVIDLNDKNIVYHDKDQVVLKVKVK